MAYLVVDRNGRREFRWLENGLRGSRRLPRGEKGDRILADLRAHHEAKSESVRACRNGIVAAITEADDMRRELEALGSVTRASLSAMLEPPLTYDHVHGTIVRTDRMSTEKIKAEAGDGPRFNRFRWCMRVGEPVGMDPTFELRSRLAAKFWPGDTGRQLGFMTNLSEVEAELLDGDDTPVARLLVGDLVLTWVHSLWADNELVWETHRVGIAPAATVALTRRAESLSRRFHGALRLWESYCLRTRGEAPAFPTPASNRVSRYFANAN